MASVGDLWMSLGLKETVSESLKKLKQEFSGTDDKAKDVQKTIKEISDVLKKSTDTNAIGGAFTKLSSLLEKSKTDAQDLSVVLKSLNAKDTLTLFNGGVTASNAKSYLELVRKINDAINGLGRTPRGGVFDLSYDLGKAAQFLDMIANVKNSIKAARDFAGTLDKNSAFLAGFDEIGAKLKRIRQQMMESFNDGSWGAKNTAFEGSYNAIISSLMKQMADVKNASSATQEKVAESASVGASALKKEEEQAKKTAEAVASIGEKRKPTVMNEGLQEAAFNKEIDKLTKSSASAKEAGNGITAIKKQSEEANSSVSKLRVELNEVLNAFRGSGSKYLGVGDAGEKGRQYVDILNQINKQKELLSRKEGGDVLASLMSNMVNNAMAYLRLLQRIETAERSLQDKKSANPNIDASKFKEASNVISHFKEQLMGLESSKFLTGVDSASVLKNYASAWQMALGDIDKIIGKFQKRNPLSDLDSNFSKIDSRIDIFREKLAKLRDLMSEGTGKGFNTSMLSDRIAGMSGIVVQMEKALNNDGKVLSNADRMKQLFNDMQVEMSKTTAALQAYGREKSKSISLSREQAKASETAARQQNNEELASAKLLGVFKQMANAYMRLEELKGRAKPLGIDTSEAQRALASLLSISNKVREMQESGANKGKRGWVAEELTKLNFGTVRKEVADTINALNKLVVAKERALQTDASKQEKEIAAVTRRYQQFFDALNNLRNARTDTFLKGGDITRVDAQIRNVIAALHELRTIRNTGVGKLTDVQGADSRSLQLAVQTAREQLSLNRQRVSENERVRQATEAEALSAAKLRDILSQISALQVRYGRAASGAETSGAGTSAAYAKLQELVSLYQRWKQMQDSGKELGKNWLGGEMRKSNFATTISETRTLIGEIERLNREYDKTQGKMDAVFGKTSNYKMPFVNEKSVSDLQRTYEKAFDALGVKADELREKMRKMSPTFDGKDWQGKLLSNRDLDAFINMKMELAGIERQMSSLVTLSERLQASTQGMKNATYKPYSYNAEEDAQKIAQRTADIKQAYRERAEAQRKAADEAKKAASEEAAAMKQRNRELYASSERIKSLELLLGKLREKQATGIKLGADTTKIDEAIQRAESLKSVLRTISQELSHSEWRTNNSLGQVKGYGTGQDIASIRALGQAQDKVNREKQKVNELFKAFQNANKAAGQMNSTLQDLKSLFMQGGLVYGAQQFVMSIITVGGEMEKQHIALQSILGDIQNANTMFGQIKQLALDSPFTFSELNKDVKQLAAYGVEYENLYDTTKRLADMSSGLGVSFERIALAFGQVQARGWLDGKELRQIAYAGIPLLSKLSEMYSKREGKTVTTSQIKKRISNREVSFEDVKSIFWEMTDAGGQFYNMQSVLANTLLGRYNKLKDAWEIMLSEFASGKSVVGGTFSFILDRITDLVQAMNSLGPVIAAAFTGFALKKGVMALGGTMAANFLTLKGNLASQYQQKALSGKKLTPVEAGILKNRDKITAADIKTLAAQKAINKVELQRLFVSGQITKEMYKQGAAALGVSAKVTRAGAAASLMLGTMKKGAMGLWSMIGGLPGLLLTGLMMGIAYFTQKSSQLKQNMQNTAEELRGRFSSISEFLNENKAAEVISRGDTKEIDNTIEAYKDKLKEIAAFDYQGFMMRANEKKSHEERLDYLDKQIKLLQEANRLADLKLSNSDFYSDLRGGFEDAGKSSKIALGSMSNIELSRGKFESSMVNWLKSNFKQVANDPNVISTAQDMVNTIITHASDADWGDARKELEQKLMKAVKGLSETQARSYVGGMTFNYGQNIDFKNLKENLKKYEKAKDEIARLIKDRNPNLQTNESERAQAKVMMDSMMASLSETFSQDQIKMLRGSLEQALGIGDDTIKQEFAATLGGLVDETFPEIANKIRSGRELDDASKEKVRKLISKAAEELKVKYPDWANTLQGLLDASQFQAVIQLVYDAKTPMGALEKQVYGNYVPSMLDGEELRNKNSEYDKYLKPYVTGKESYYEATNAMKTAIDNAYNEMVSRKAKLAKGKVSQEAYDESKSEYKALIKAAEEGLGYDYLGEKKKSNKVGKGGRRDDAELRKWRERVNAAKTFYQEYKKYKDVMGPDKAMEQVKDLYPNAVADMDVNNYTGSFQKIIDNLGAGWFAKSTERKQFLTSIKKEIKEWNLAEVFKRQAEEASAAFNEALENGINQYDLYKSLLEKTGDKEFASQAFKDGAVWDDNSRGLAQQFKSMTGEEIDLDATDVQAKHHLENIEGAYELWKKIVDLVRGKYTEYLTNAASIIEQTMSTAQKIEGVNAKYERLIAIADEHGDVKLSNSLHNKQTKERSALEFSEFKELVNWEGVFSNLELYTKKELRTLRGSLKTFLANGRRNGMTNEVQENIVDGIAKIDQTLNGAILGGLNSLKSVLKEADNEVKEAGSELAKAYYEYGRKSTQFEEALKRYNNAIANQKKARGNLDNKKTDRIGAVADLGNMFARLGNSNGSGSTFLSNVGEMYTTIANMGAVTTKQASKNSKIGSLIGMIAGIFEVVAEKGLKKFIGDAFEDIGTAVNSIFDTFGLGIGISDANTKYKDAKAEYENLVDVWDSLIERKKTYLSENWGSEAANAAEEAIALTENEMAATRLLAKARLDAGSSAGSHSYDYRMWKGSYAATPATDLEKSLLPRKGSTKLTWQNVASYISRERGVKFDGMSDLADMSAKDLLWIKSNFSGLWSNMDGDFRDYIEKIISLGDELEDLEEDLAEKISGLRFSSLVTEWGDAMATMANSSQDLADTVEDSLKSAILKAMVQTAYGDEIKALITKIKKYGTNASEVYDENGKDISEYTKAEMEDIRNDTDDLTKRIEETRDYLKGLYGWSDDSSSSVSSSIKSITEETADLLASYINAIRLDVSVNRVNIQQIMTAVNVLPNMNTIAQSQLTELSQLVTLATIRNQRLDEIYSWMSGVVNGTKKIHVA